MFVIAWANISASSKAGIGRLIEKVYALEELYKETNTPCPGSPHPPFATITHSLLAESQTAILAAQKARSYYNLGLAPLGNLCSFLDAQGLLAFLIPFGKEKNAISGLFFSHTKLGQIIALTVLARHLGYSYSCSQDSNSFISLEKRNPRIFIELAYRAIEEEKLSLRRVAEMLGISDIELEARLYVEARKEVEEILS